MDSYLSYQVDVGNTEIEAMSSNADNVLKALEGRSIEEVCYVITSKRFSDDTKEPTNLRIQGEVRRWQTIAKGEFQPISLPAERMKLLKSWNNEEWLRLNAELEYWERRSMKHPENVEYKNNILFYQNVIKEFEKWYDEFDLELPSSDKPSVTIPVPGSRIEVKTNPQIAVRRLKLSPSKNEKLNEDITEAVQEFIDSGNGSQEQAFEYVNKNSENLFGIALTKGQVEGRYKRVKKNNTLVIDRIISL
jgi:hypothetical protein